MKLSTKVVESMYFKAIMSMCYYIYVHSYIANYMHVCIIIHSISAEIIVFEFFHKYNCCYICIYLIV